MAKKSKYESLTDAVVSVLNTKLEADVNARKKEYAHTVLQFSEEEGDFNECMSKFPSIKPYIEKAREDWMHQKMYEFVRGCKLQSSIPWTEERVIEGKIALFTDEQLSNLTIEELASLVRP